jgi:sugar phosphate isomerase/epimerase
VNTEPETPGTSRLYISTSAINTQLITEAVETLAAITPNIELSGGSAYTPGLLDELMELKAKKGLNYLVHAYFPPAENPFLLNFADPSNETRAFITKTMEFVNAFNIQYYSVHAGFRNNFKIEDELLKESGSRVSFTLADIKKNIKWFTDNFPGKGLALENLFPNNFNKECCFMMRAAEVDELLDDTEECGLLLDLGHLKISSGLLGFEYMEAAERIFSKYASTIAEIHVSENEGQLDDHDLITNQSLQLAFIRNHAPEIDKHGINITIETRGASLEELKESYRLLSAALKT